MRSKLIALMLFLAPCFLRAQDQRPPEEIPQTGNTPAGYLQFGEAESSDPEAAAVEPEAGFEATDFYGNVLQPGEPVSETGGPVPAESGTSGQGDGGVTESVQTDVETPQYYDASINNRDAAIESPTEISEVFYTALPAAFEDISIEAREVVTGEAAPQTLGEFIAQPEVFEALLQKSSAPEEFTADFFGELISSTSSDAGFTIRPPADGPSDISAPQTSVPDLVRSAAQFDSLFEAVKKIITDRREDFFSINDIAHQQQARSVVAITLASYLHPAGEQIELVPEHTYGEAFNLCDTELFRDQPSACFCTGVLLSPTIVLTARHCFDEIRTRDARILLDYAMTQGGGGVNLMFNPSQVISFREHPVSPMAGSMDFILLELETPVKSRYYPALPSPRRIAPDAEVHTFGFPGGLPLKRVTNGKILRNSDPESFSASLEAFIGNSGSPVFNSETQQLEGIIVEGLPDFVNSGGCNVVSRCGEAKCTGEKVLRISEVIRFLEGNAPDLLEELGK